MDIFEYQSYKKFLRASLPVQGKRRGIRSRLATFLNCQTGFISQVLNGDSHFSMEHILKICKFLELASKEKDFLVLLASKGKAGNTDLKDFYKEKINEVAVERSQIKNRLQTTVVSSEDYNLYYSHWYYSAIHIITSIPAYQSVETICSRLSLQKNIVVEVLDFLVEKGFVIKGKSKFKVGKQRIHLSHKSNLISKHHTNWRIEALKSLEMNDETQLHYSSVISLSKTDYRKVKNIIIKSIENIDQVLIPSNEEELCSLNIDFFTI